MTRFNSSKPLDPREQAALSAFEAEAQVFAAFGAPRPSDSELITRLLDRTLDGIEAPSASMLTGTVAAKSFATAIVAVTVAVVAMTIRRSDPRPETHEVEAKTFDRDASEPSEPETEPILGVPRIALPNVAKGEPETLTTHRAESEAGPPPRGAMPVVSRGKGRNENPLPFVDAAEDTAAELLRRGNAARREGKIELARDVYRDLRRRFPGSREDILVRMILARLELEQFGDGAAALEQLDAYLRDQPNGNLAMEASLARIKALRRLGRIDEERRALEAFLERFPDSVHGEEARNRVAELVR